MTWRRNDWGRTWEMVRPYRWSLLVSLLLLIVLTILGLLPPVLIAKIIGKALPDHDVSLFVWCVALFFVTHVASAIIALFQGHQMRIIGGRVVFDLRRKMYRHLHRLSLSFYENRGAGEIMARLMNDVAAITTLITGTALDAIVSAFRALAILGVLFYTSWQVALVALAVMPLHFLSSFLFKQRIAHQTRRMSEKTAQIWGKANEVFDSAKMVKAYSAEAREVRSLLAQLREAFELSVRTGFLSATWGSTSGIISQAGTVLVMLVCGMAVLRNQSLTLEQYVLILTYIGMLYAPIAQLIAVANQVIPARVGIQRVFEILDLHPEVEDVPNGLREPVRGHVRFDNVSFAYPSGMQVIHNLTFEAKPGEMIAFVGPSGSGKTTLANLIARFYDRTDGRIEIDGQDIQEYALPALRSQMSMVLQETNLFRGSVRENLRYGRPDATDEQVEHAARLANAHEFIAALPDGYDTLIGSHGARLSGGQRQRLAIARALLCEPRILILDEATSALDTSSEMKVQKALSQLMKDRTTFVIAHRLSTIKNADKIVVLRNGRIEQVGTHDELMEQGGLYRELYDPQWARQKAEEQEQQIRELAAVA